MSYLGNAPSRRATPQTSPIPGSGQVENSAGGFVWTIEPIDRLRRWLVLGSEGGSYYATETDLTVENVQVLAEVDPAQALSLIAEVSAEGLAPKNDPAIFALAYFAAHERVEIRRAALALLPVVCRTGTHLYHFLQYVEKQRGWGRSLRRAVAKWLVDKPAEAAAYQMVKYRQRDGWAARDVLRLAHPAASVSSGNPTVGVTPEHAALFDWICGRKPKGGYSDLPGVVRGFRKAQKPNKSNDQIVEYIRRYNLPREAIPPEYLTDEKVWKALLYSGEHGMPMTAMVRNLPTMTRVGLLVPMGKETDFVCKKLLHEEAIRHSKIHPLQILVALNTYASGHSIRGSATWSPVPAIIDALDRAFYLSFGNVEPTGKRTLLALDVSGSMGWGDIAGMPGITPRIASAAMSLITAAVEDRHGFVAFSHTLTPIVISPRQRLDDVVRQLSGIPMGGTDCALPMLAAAEQRIEVDTFVVYTDNETWAGRMHPAQALNLYRERSGVDARLAVVGMTATEFSIADPNDPGMMDVVGFDTAAPGLISEFSAGRL